MSKKSVRLSVNVAKKIWKVKTVKMSKTVKVASHRSVPQKPLRSPAIKTREHVPNQPRHGKPADKGNAAKGATPEPEVVIKPIKWPAAELQHFREKLHGCTIWQ